MVSWATSSLHSYMPTSRIGLSPMAGSEHGNHTNILHKQTPAPPLCPCSQSSQRAPKNLPSRSATATRERNMLVDFALFDSEHLLPPGFHCEVRVWGFAALSSMPTINSLISCSSVGSLMSTIAIRSVRTSSFLWISSHDHDVDENAADIKQVDRNWLGKATHMLGLLLVL